MTADERTELLALIERCVNPVVTPGVLPVNLSPTLAILLILARLPDDVQADTIEEVMRLATCPPHAIADLFDLASEPML